MGESSIGLPVEHGVAAGGSAVEYPRAAGVRESTGFRPATARRSIDKLLESNQTCSFGVSPATQDVIRTPPNSRVHSVTWRQPDAVATDEIESLLQRAASLRSSGVLARQSGEEAAAEEYFRDAFGLALDIWKLTAGSGSHSSRLGILRAAALLALDCGDAAEARRLILEALAADPSIAYSDEWEQLRDVTKWPDAWLVAAVRREPPDVPALDALADRYWKSLFGRCQLLTVDRQKASDLAQESWCRVLKARGRLKPGGNFQAYLMTIATNLWRDLYRSAKRAGAMADHRLASLDDSLCGDEGENVALADVLPDLNALRTGEQRLLAMDIDQAMERLTPVLRDVLVARFLTGESCAEIGRRYGRTEQTVSAWVRQAIREMKLYFEKLPYGVALKEEV